MKFATLALVGFLSGLLTTTGCNHHLSLPAPDGLVITQVQLPKANEPAPLPFPPQGKVPVAFVIGQDAEVLDFCGPLEVFAAAHTSEGVQAFECYTVAEKSETVIVGGPMKVVPDYTFKNAPAPKVIVIPAMAGSAATPAMTEWIREASKQTDVTMSVCNGAFVLAKTGLLSGKKATSHHGGYFRLAGLYPDLKLKRGARFTEDGNLACAGGVSSGIDLALRVVQRYLGTESVRQLADGIEYQGDGWQNPDANEVYATMPELEGGHETCPLCRMQGDSQIKSEFKGKKYIFCSHDEKEFFDQHLNIVERFLEEDAMKQSSKSK